jgi:hypothetical protein
MGSAPEQLLRASGLGFRWVGVEGMRGLLECKQWGLQPHKVAAAWEAVQQLGCWQTSLYASRASVLHDVVKGEGGCVGFRHVCG